VHYFTVIAFFISYEISVDVLSVDFDSLCVLAQVFTYPVEYISFKHNST